MPQVMVARPEPEHITWDYSPKQNELLDLLENPAVHVVTYGGAKGGGKSVAGVRWVFRYCEAIIERFHLQPSVHPIPVAFMGRKRLSDFCRTTRETWYDQIPGQAFRENQQQHEFIIRNTV
jgi:hypothetical protein